MNATVDTLSNKHCLILGLGDTGLSCARFLVDKALSVTVMDSREATPHVETIKQELPQVLVHAGGIDPLWLQQADIVIASPGIDLRMPEIVTIKESGIEVIGDVELFARYADAPIVAITGSNGKSTVTTLLSLMAKMAGIEVKTGGNIGTPALALLDSNKPDFYILELSSFQLETITSLNAFAATVLNVTPDHMDRYDSLNDYRAEKQKIYQGDGVMVINLDDPLVANMSVAERDTIGFSLKETNDIDFGLREFNGELWIAQGTQPLVAIKQLKLMGSHNVANVMAALALGSVMALPMTAMLSASLEFKGLPHRGRLVRRFKDVNWVDDSKSTNVGACIAAIEGLSDNGNIILIAGGVGKEQDFSALTPVLQHYVSTVILIGEDAEKIAQVVPDDVQIINAKDMRDAVTNAREIAHASDSVLLSPACASFDMYKSYVERGEDFERLVNEVKL